MLHCSKHAPVSETTIIVVLCHSNHKKISISGLKVQRDDSSIKMNWFLLAKFAIKFLMTRRVLLGYFF